MRGTIGDRVFSATSRPGHLRSGRIVALRHPDGTPPYVVRWDDSVRDEVYFPRGLGEPARPVWPGGPPEPGVRRRLWRIELELVEDDDGTTALALLHEDPDPSVIVAEARTPRHITDPELIDVEDEQAVARVLAELSTTLAHAVDAVLSDVRRGDVDVRAVRLSQR
jgi:hypothetical protein